MPGLKEVRLRIASVNSTKQITSAMKMVSASKLRKAQGAILRLRPYAARLSELLAKLGGSIENVPESAYFEKRTGQKILMVLVSSNRGLCGAFNANIIKAALAKINGEYAQAYKQGTLHLMCIGKKAAEYFQRRKFNIIAQPHEIFDNLNWDNASILASDLMARFSAAEYDKIEIIYHLFRNATTQVVSTETFLPVSEKDQATNKQKSGGYIFEPGREEILSDLVPRSLKIQFYKAVLDSWASEHGARMTAMHKATDNAEDLLRELKLSYNKARQATITREIIEIVSGANALEG